ncbi:MAG: lipoyl(octanoyl) transferase LipB [Myxococcota bacterium]
MTPPLHVKHLGTVPYVDGLRIQRELREARLRDDVEDTLLLLEHPPVITVTRRHGRANVLVDDATLAARGVELHEADRGGDVTAHAPGQLVAYPVVKLHGAEKDLPRYVRNLEGAVIDVLAQYGLVGVRVPGESGVFMEPTVEGGRLEKVCAIGVKGTRWVMSHGLALNVRTDLSVFSLIVPCGLQHRGVTSLRERLGEGAPSVGEAGVRLAEALARSLGRMLAAPGQ